MKFYVKTADGRILGWVIAADEEQAYHLAYRKFPTWEPLFVELGHR